MGLLCQFNNVLQYKQGTGQKMVINRHVQGMYDWVMQDVAKQVCVCVCASVCVCVCLEKDVRALCWWDVQHTMLMYA